MILYNDILDLIVSSRDLSSETSLGLLTAHASNLDSMWSEFRTILYKERVAGNQIPFDFSTLSKKYMIASGGINDLIKSSSTEMQCE